MTKTFIECFAQLSNDPHDACYKRLNIPDKHANTDQEARRYAISRGWQVAGHGNTKRTRCPKHKHIKASTPYQKRVGFMSTFTQKP